MTISWQKNLISGEVATGAWDATASVLYSYHCADSLNIGDQDYAFVTDGQGAGAIHIDGKPYMMQPGKGEGVAACTRRL